MSLKLNSSGGGSVTLQEPVTANNQTLTLPDVTGTIAVQGGTGVGKVLQVVNVYKQDIFSTTATSPTDVTGLSVSITPSATTSKILVLLSLSGGVSPNDGGAQLVRNSTNIAVGTGGSVFNVTGTFQGDIPNRYGVEQICMNILDAPATTSALTYKVQVFCFSGGNTVYVNRRGESAGYGAPSTITVMEIAA